MMSKLATIAFGAALAVAPAVIYAQNAPSDQTSNQTQSTAPADQTGANTNPAPGTANNNMATPSNNLGPNAGNYNPNMGTSSSSTGAENNTANAGTTANRAMPRTADNWLGLLLFGSLLSGAGAMLRRLCRA